MVTERLYQRQPYVAEFDAVVAECLEWEGKPAVVLDVTCFYPTSGGQPNDLGTLAGVPVLDVVEQDERIMHILAAPLRAGPVHGVVDWARRFDHMQQHSGQHILSQACERILQAETVSFHLGNVCSTIDLALPALDWEAVGRVEELANRIVLENRPIHVQEYAEAEIGVLHLRKPPLVHGLVRVVQVEDFDTCACGGTHVRAAGEVGSIHIRRWERRRGQTRIEFLCGWRALRDHRLVNTACQATANALSTAAEDLPVVVAKLIEAGQSQDKQIAQLRKRLLLCELPTWAAQAQPLGTWHVLVRVLQEYEAASMRLAAQQLIQQPGLVVLLGVNDPAPQVCFARAKDVDLHMGQVLRTVLAAYGGRGGGEAHMAQGGGIRADQLESVLQMAVGELAGGQRA